MYYDTPDVNAYVKFIQKYRTAILVIFSLLFLSAIKFVDVNLVSSYDVYWLEESKEFQRTNKKEYKTNYISKLTLNIGDFNETTHKKLQELLGRIEAIDGVVSVRSLFSEHSIKNDGDKSESSLLNIVEFSKLSSEEIKLLLQPLEHSYDSYISEDLSRVSFFIYSDKAIDLTFANITFPYMYNQLDKYVEWKKYYSYIIVAILLLLLLYKLIFKNIISAIGGIFVILLTTVGTFTFITLFTGIKDVQISMPIIAISIAMVDYLYFYYRWHVSQYKTNGFQAIQKMINRNSMPALWTSLITALGLGGLVFIDSYIIQVLSLSVIISSILAYVINLTFLPAFLSYFNVKHPKVNFAKVCYSFASNELHYNKKFLYAFLFATSILIAVGAYKLYDKSSVFFSFNVDNDIVSVYVPYMDIDLDLIEDLKQFESDLYNFSPSVTKVDTLYSVVNTINKANTQTDELDEQALIQSLFFMDLYDLSPEYMEDNALKIHINVVDIDKTALVLWLQHYKKIDLYFVDRETLVNSAKLNKIQILAASLVTALILIGIIMGGIFKNREMIFVGFLVNAIPIAWFSFSMKLLGIPLSIEVLIAMTISVGLASDATIHFAFKYFRSRHYGRSQKHALEKMFFYAGIPVIIGSLILVTVFAALNFTGIDSLMLIGTYSAILILVSLATDLFVLPVMLLLIDKFDQEGHISSLER